MTYAGRPKLGIINAPKNRYGYVKFQLWACGKRQWLLGHRVVWEAFAGPIPERMQINHKNGAKDDNRLDNLEVVTPSENSKHKYRVLGRPAPNYPSPGERNGSAKLTEDNVREIRRLYAAGGIYQYQIAKMFGVSQPMVGMIVRRENWTHVE